MEKIAILVDSSADLPKELREIENIYTIPLYININGKYYRDWIDIGPDDIVAYNDEHPDNLSKTSAPSPGDLLQAFDKISGDGYDKIFAVFINSKFSSTYQLASMLAEDYDDAEIFTIDSETVTVAETLLIAYLNDLIKEGLSFEEIKEKIDGVADKLVIHGWLDTIENIRAGGRIQGTLKKVAGLFSFHPEILIGPNANIELRKLKINSKGAIKDIIATSKDKLSDSNNYYLSIGYSDDIEPALEIKEAIGDLIDGARGFYMGQLGAVIGSHAGKGAFGVTFLRLD
ncbi:MAG: DegV family protein [Anaerococcus sp.]|nr:DegV family protein [Peptoniphilaceae bacterium]MDY2918297.1 DegV family protein [Anaerococcus sp.]